MKDYVISQEGSDCVSQLIDYTAFVMQDGTDLNHFKGGTSAGSSLADVFFHAAIMHVLARCESQIRERGLQTSLNVRKGLPFLYLTHKTCLRQMRVYHV